VAGVPIEMGLWRLGGDKGIVVSLIDAAVNNDQICRVSGGR
jgi:hypothetical protein